MPYPNEKAGYNPIRRIMSSEKVKGLLKRLKKAVPDIASDFASPVSALSAGAGEHMPNIVLAIDGSYHVTPIEENYPGAEIGYLTVASVLIFLDKIKAANEDDIINPVKFRAASETGSIEIVLPGRNILLDSESSGKFSMRKILFEEMQQYSVFDDGGETLLDTYQHLADISGEKKPSCPCEEDDEKYRYKHGAYACENTINGGDCNKILYSTDAMRIHELFSDIDSCDKMYGQTMFVLERLLLIHILRTFEKMGEKWLSLIRDIVFIMDGPLAIYGASAWLSDSFRTELARINDVQKKITGIDMLIMGVEKTGNFANHLEMIDRDPQGHPGKFPMCHYHLLDNDYIRRHIQPSDDTREYGRNTYFGRKLFYRTSRGHLLVVNMAYYNEDQRKLKSAHLWQYPRLDDALKVLDNLSSNMYPNSISPLIAAHAEASIPLHLGQKILDKIAKTEVSRS